MGVSLESKRFKRTTVKFIQKKIFGSYKKVGLHEEDARTFFSCAFNTTFLHWMRPSRHTRVKIFCMNSRHVLDAKTWFLSSRHHSILEQIFGPKKIISGRWWMRKIFINKIVENSCGVNKIVENTGRPKIFSFLKFCKTDAT